MIQPGRTYQQCDSRVIVPTRIRIDKIDADRADFTYLTTNRPGVIHGAIRLNQLHDSPTTRDGRPRRTGYALEQQ
ncbi:hypothetical protein [Kitasatospora sp. NPDC001175]|uniref:hypothetical protein n=1 Tax=Kitasatospora sp. NPDC001175 TaxID=3157103 RepID=UPI003CFED30F